MQCFGQFEQAARADSRNRQQERIARRRFTSQSGEQPAADSRTRTRKPWKQSEHLRDTDNHGVAGFDGAEVAYLPADDFGNDQEDGDEQYAKGNDAQVFSEWPFDDFFEREAEHGNRQRADNDQPAEPGILLIDLSNGLFP